jgi:hypothetical protein
MNWGATTYLPTTQKVAFLHAACLEVFNLATVAWERPQSVCSNISDYTLNAAFDPDHNRLYYVSGTVYGYLDGAANFAQTKLTHPSCIEIAHSYPGLTWDSTNKRMVIFLGGNTVYFLDPVSNTCTANEYPGGPGYPVTNLVGRKLQFAPSLGGFIVINESNQDVFFLRTDPSASPPDPPTGSGSITPFGGGFY